MFRRFGPQMAEIAPTHCYGRCSTGRERLGARADRIHAQRSRTWPGWTACGGRNAPGSATGVRAWIFRRFGPRSRCPMSDPRRRPRAAPRRPRAAGTAPPPPPPRRPGAPPPRRRAPPAPRPQPVLRPISRRRLPMRTSSHSPAIGSGTRAGSVTRVPLTVTPPAAIGPARLASRREDPRLGQQHGRPGSQRAGVEREPTAPLEQRAQDGRIRDRIGREPGLGIGDRLAGRGFPVGPRRDVARQGALAPAGPRAPWPPPISRASISACGELGEPAQVGPDVPIVDVEPVLVEGIRRGQFRVQPDRLASLALPELGPRRGEEQLVGQAVGGVGRPHRRRRAAGSAPGRP